MSLNIDIDDAIALMLEREPKNKEKVEKASSALGGRRINLDALKVLDTEELPPAEPPAIMPALDIAAIKSAPTKNDIEFPSSILHPEIIRSVLRKDEIPYFIERWEAYHRDFGADLNNSNDYDQLMELILQLVNIYRIEKMKKESERKLVDVNIDKVLNNAHTRVQNILTSLRARRRDRVDDKNHKEDNMIKLLLKRARSEDLGKKTIEMIKDEQTEEYKFLAMKKERGNAIQSNTGSN